jgi:flagellar FliL protein
MKDDAKPAAQPGEEAAPAADPRRRRKLLILIGACVLGIGGGAAAGFLALRGKSPAEPESQADSAAAEHEEAHPAPEEVREEHGPSPESELGRTEFVPLETLIVNVRDEERTRYLKVKAEVELTGPGARAELEQRMPQVKDFLIGLLSNQTYAVLQSLEGKAHVREELQTRLNSLLRKGRVLGVYFTEFVIQ